MQYSQGSRTRALLVTLIVGSALTLTAVRLVDRRLRRRSATGPDLTNDRPLTLAST
jgi:hypothetical protein